MSKKNKLREQIANGRTRQVINELLSLTKGDAELHDEATALSARFQKYNREKHGNTAPAESLDIELNRIHEAALDLIGRLPDGAHRPWLFGWKKMAAAIVSFIVFGAAVTKFSGYSLRDVFSQNNAPVTENPPVEKRPEDTAKTIVPTTDPPGNPVEKTSGQKPPPVRQTPPADQSKQSEKTPEPVPDKLTIDCKTDKGKSKLIYQKGETMHLYFRANRPCHIRILYRLADGSIVLFDDDRQLSATEVGHYVEIGDGYEAAAPFGEEELYVFAQNGAFPKLNTAPHPDGYLLVTDGLPEAKRKTRGFKKKYRFAETMLRIKTEGG